MSTADKILAVGAGICFAISIFREDWSGRLVPLGLLLWVATLIVP